jgi:hypothetical protein
VGKSMQQTDTLTADELPHHLVEYVLYQQCTCLSRVFYCVNGDLRGGSCLKMARQNQASVMFCCSCMVIFLSKALR